MKSKFFFLLLFPFLTFGGGLEDHLKKVGEKPKHHQIKNIDFIYMINLDQRPEKWELSNRQLNPYGIFPYRFSAVNGWELSLEAINEIGLKFDSSMRGGDFGTSFLPENNFEASHDFIEKIGQVYFYHRTSLGAIGITLSHLSVLYDALQSNYETIWVMEDDIEVLSDPRQIPELIEKLDLLVGKGNWDVLFTDRNVPIEGGRELSFPIEAKKPNFQPEKMDQYYIKEQISEDFIKIGARLGAYSMILRKSGIEKIYNFISSHAIFYPYDRDYYLPPGIKLYTVVENVVSHLVHGLSDNRKRSYK